MLFQPGAFLQPKLYRNSGAFKRRLNSFCSTHLIILNTALDHMLPGTVFSYFLSLGLDLQEDCKLLSLIFMLHRASQRPWHSQEITKDFEMLCWKQTILSKFNKLFLFMSSIVLMLIIIVNNCKHSHNCIFNWFLQLLSTIYKGPVGL